MKRPSLLGILSVPGLGTALTDMLRVTPEADPPRVRGFVNEREFAGTPRQARKTKVRVKPRNDGTEARGLARRAERRRRGYFVRGGGL